MSQAQSPGAVVYTQISVWKNPDGSIPFDKVRVGDWLPATAAGARKSYELDVDGDGKVDFGLYSTLDGTDAGITASGVSATPHGTLQILGCPYPPPWGNADAIGLGLVSGTIIGADTPSLFDPIAEVQWGGSDYLTGRFNLLTALVSTGQAGTFLIEGDDDPRFLAFRFLKEGEWHYGWLEAAGGAMGLEILGIAWETDPNRAITAGVIPEPSGSMLFATGASILTLLRRRKSPLPPSLALKG